jgi:hypothetical protein
LLSVAEHDVESRRSFPFRFETGPDHPLPLAGSMLSMSNRHPRRPSFGDPPSMAHSCTSARRSAMAI